MKKLSLIALSICTFIASSCSNNEESVENTPNLKSNPVTRYVPEDFEIFGIKHNEGLDFFYDKFKNSTASTPGEFKELMITSTTEYVKDFALELDPNADTSFATNLTQNYEIELMNFDKDFYTNVPDADQISTNARVYLDKLHNVLFDIPETATLVDVVSNIKSIEMEAYDNVKLDNKDLTYVFTASAIARHSLAYWNDNYDAWENVFINNGFFNGPSQNGGGNTTMGAGSQTLRGVGIVVGMDVAGGVVAAGATWAVNVFIPPPGGQAAYGAAILGGAIRGSGMAAAGLILNAMFDLW
jgi:hypothetical protein